MNPDELIDRSLTALESLPKNYQDASKKLATYTEELNRSNLLLEQSLVKHRTEKEAYLKLKTTQSFLENKINSLENENSAKSLVLQTKSEDLFAVKKNILHLNQELVGSFQIGSQREKIIDEYKEKIQLHEEKIQQYKLAQLESCSELKNIQNLKEVLTLKKVKLENERSLNNKRVNNNEIEILKATAAFHQSSIEDLQTKITNKKMSQQNERKMKNESILAARKRDLEQQIAEKTKLFQHKTALENRIKLLKRDLNL